MRAWRALYAFESSFSQHLSTRRPNRPGLTLVQIRTFSSKPAIRKEDFAGSRMEPIATDYTTWTNSELIARVVKLEHQLRTQNAAHANSLRLQQSLTVLEHRLDTQSSGADSQDGERSSRTQAEHNVSGLSNVAKTQRIKPTSHREFDPSKYSTRFIALKIAYLGREYNGFEWHANNPTPLPTVEEVLWQALSKTKLIFPDGGTAGGQVNWQGTEYSKCGRTDKGVSAFGQVIGLRVRSARPKENTHQPINSTRQEQHQEAEKLFDHTNDELEYCKILNRVLPSDIRVLAWCPTPPADFSARFSCKERQYRYFFTQPAYAPRSGRAGLKSHLDGGLRRYGWLDLTKMQAAAKLFEGSHDFRNFCKIDPARQVTDYKRVIYFAAIEESAACSSMPLFVERQAFGPSTTAGHQFVSKCQVFTFTVHGSAFLYHQVRCMVAVLFLVGQGLEEPEIINELLDVELNPAKPLYDMADESPLVLWDCIYPVKGDYTETAGLEWVFPDEQVGSGILQSPGDGRYAPGNIDEVLWAGWRRKKIDEVLAGNLLDIVAVQGSIEPAEATADGKLSDDSNSIPSGRQGTRVFLGGDGPRIKGEYTPLMQRDRMDTFDVLNARYSARKGMKFSSPSTAA